MLALKDHNNAFSELLNETRKYIRWALILQYIAGPAAVLTLFSILHASLEFMIYAMTYIILALMGGRIFAPIIIYLIIIYLIKPKPKRSMKSALNGIINNARATIFTIVLAFELLLLTMINAKLPWQSDLAIIVPLLVVWLIIAYFPTILAFISKYYDYYDYFEYDEMIPWDLELVNIWLSDPDIRRGYSANGGSFVALSLDNGQKLEGRLVRVKRWGMILEDISKRAKLYIRWERIAAVELMAAIN